MASEKSSFSQACSLLRQYLKENGSIGELSLGVSCNLNPNKTKGGFEMSRPVATRTMDLFPISDKPADGLSAASLRENKLAAKKPEAAQMTIFYGGQVIVVDDLPADKAEEIMFFASQQNLGTLPASNPGTEQFPPLANPVKVTTGPGNCICPDTSDPSSKFGNALMPEQVHCQSTRPVICDLPIQRKASLHRFLEKRKERIIRSAPYSKPAETDQSTFSKPFQANLGTAKVAVERDLLSNLSS